MRLQSRNGGRQEKIIQAIIIQGGVISTSYEMQINFSGGSSVQFSHSVMSVSLQTHGLQQTRLPCPSPAPRAYSNSCPLSQWWKPAISSFVIPFFSCPQSFPASGSFQMSQLFASGGQIIGVSASASVLPMNIQGTVQGTLKSLLQHQVQKHQFFDTQLSLWSYSHIHTLMPENT